MNTSFGLERKHLEGTDAAPGGSKRGGPQRNANELLTAMGATYAKKFNGLPELKYR